MSDKKLDLDNPPSFRDKILHPIDSHRRTVGNKRLNRHIRELVEGGGVKPKKKKKK